jgi:ribonuclease-3
MHMNDQTLSSSAQGEIQGLQAMIGYRFNDLSLLTRAVTHRSFQVEHPEEGKGDNETLEFLGDAVLDLVIGALLFTTFPAMAEGELTKLRSALVQENHLAVVARDLQLGRFLRLGKGEDQSGGREKASILASAYEAVIGALFVDSGYSTGQRIVAAHFQERVQPMQHAVQAGDAKSALQELTQEQYNVAPLYLLDKAEGPDHAKTFTVSVQVQGQLLATASAHNKKAAEQKAAGLALAMLRQP